MKLFIVNMRVHRLLWIRRVRVIVQSKIVKIILFRKLEGNLKIKKDRRRRLNQ